MAQKLPEKLNRTPKIKYTFSKMSPLGIGFKLLRQISNYPSYILVISFGVFLLPFVYVDALTHKTGLPKFAFISLISLLAFITWLISLYKKSISNLYFNNLFFLLIAIFVLSLSSVFWSEFLGKYQLEIINFASLLMLSFTCMQINQLSHTKLILFSAVIGGAITTCIAFIQAWGWNPLGYIMVNIPAASFINKNHFSNYIDLLIPVSFSLLIISKTPLNKWLSAFCVSLLVSYLLYSHTRASWISLLLILSLILYFSYKLPWLQKEFKKTKSVYIIFIFLFSFLLLNSPAPTKNEAKRFTKLYSSMMNTKIESSASIRLNANYNILKMIKEKPILGTGLGSFNVAFRPYSYNLEEKRYVEPTLLQLHNDPLQIVVELGLIGFILCLIFTLSILYKSYQNFSSHYLNSSNERILQMGILLAIIASASHSLLSFPLHMPGPSFLLFIFIGLLLNTNQNEIKISRKLIIFFVFVGLTITFFSSKFYLAFTTSSFYLNTAVETISTHHPQHQYKKIITLDNEENCLKAQKYTEKAMEIYSNDFSMHTQASSIYVNCEKTPISI